MLQMNKCKLFFQKQHNILFKYLFLFWFGGSTYCTIEVLYRGYSHWTMLVLAGFLFVIIGLLNELWTWNTSFFSQVFSATLIATLSEFFAGCIINILLGWNVWNYSEFPGNILGQVCPQFTLLWVFISSIAIILDDVIRWKFFGEEKPHYTLFGGD